MRDFLLKFILHIAGYRWGDVFVARLPGFMSFPVSLHNWCSSASLLLPKRNRPFVMAAAGCGLGDGKVFGQELDSPTS